MSSTNLNNPETEVGWPEQSGEILRLSFQPPSLYQIPDLTTPPYEYIMNASTPLPLSLPQLSPLFHPVFCNIPRDSQNPSPIPDLVFCELWTREFFKNTSPVHIMPGFCAFNIFPIAFRIKAKTPHHGLWGSAKPHSFSFLSCFCSPAPSGLAFSYFQFLQNQALCYLRDFAPALPAVCFAPPLCLHLLCIL